MINTFYSARADVYRLNRVLPDPDEWADICDCNADALMRDGVLHTDDWSEEAKPPPPSCEPNFTWALPVRAHVEMPTAATKTRWSPPDQAEVVIRTVTVKDGPRILARCYLQILDVARLSESARAALVRGFMADALCDVPRTPHQIIAALTAAGLNVERI